jgi:hypothetical protein
VLSHELSAFSQQAWGHLLAGGGRPDGCAGGDVILRSGVSGA